MFDLFKKKNPVFVPHSVDSDQTPLNAVSDQNPHYVE